MLRLSLLQRVQTALDDSPVVALLGPRQAGKTTLARQFLEQKGAAFPWSTNYLDLEDPLTAARLENPMLTLKELEGVVVIDEIQRAAELFPVLRVLADRPGNPARFLILGSASRDLIRQSSETLAGRIRFIEVTPFQLRETGVEHMRQLWLRGGFPRSFLAEDEPRSFEWRQDFVRTFLERDIPQLGIEIPVHALRRFWLMLAHYHGQIFNASELGRSLGISDTTARRYLDVLAGTFMARVLQPWYENIGKRQVKSPKLFFRDSGIFHHLLGVRDRAELSVHPKLGASWEGFALEQVIQCESAAEEEVFFWGVHQQAELDLLLVRGGKRVGYEIKYTDRPALTPSLRKAIELLKLDRASVVYPGDVTFPLADNVQAIGLSQLAGLKSG